MFTVSGCGVVYSSWSAVATWKPSRFMAHVEIDMDESEGMDADDDDGASAGSSGTDTSGRTNPLVWS